jgi:hypothetical protein
MNPKQLKAELKASFFLLVVVLFAITSQRSFAGYAFSPCALSFPC